MFEDIGTALRLVFGSGKYRYLAIASSAILFALYISVPVLTIPGDSYGFFLKIVSPWELALTILLSVAMGVVLAMQVYAWRNNAHRIQQAGAGLAGVISGSISAIFTGASCASCMSAFFSFLGFGGILFLIQHRAEIMAFTFVILGVSVYLTSNRIAGNCRSCGIAQPEDTVHKGKKQES